ncbi:MAG: hypothetical protein ACREMD_00045, partial [Gemmatimonadota bacterium]
MATLHIVADESGDFTFGPQGTRHYVFAVAWTYEPAELARRVTELRIKLLKQGHDVPFFSAAEDKEANRQAFIRTILGDDGWH